MARTVGFFTDTTLCIGCKACEVACKEWNQLPGHTARFGDGYDNTGQLDEQNWRHVQFHERTASNGRVAWNMMSDVCKHCALASCMEVCPTGAIMRTEFDTVYIQPSVCNGCRDCIAACPYHVIGFNEQSGLAQKCTFCYDRLQANLMPACAKACPTESIKFGDLSTMRDVAGARLNTLRAQGMSEARLYGDKEYGGLHALFLITDDPKVYGLPDAASAVLPSRNNVRGYLGSLVTAIIGAVGAIIAFRERGGEPVMIQHFVAPPQWEWYIVWYFFFGGIAGGAYLLGTLLRLFGDSRDEGAARVAFLVSFPAMVLCPIMLTLDLGLPLRFWHMLIDSRTFLPHLKYWSPMSVGAWALFFFGAFSTISFLEVLALEGRLRGGFFVGIGRVMSGGLGRIVMVVGSIFGAFLAGYTGVLLSVSNQPIWSDTWTLGALFLASGLSAAAAAIVLAARFRREAASSERKLSSADRYFILLELILLVAFFVSLGAVAARYLEPRWLVLWAIVLVGTIVPLALRSVHRGAVAVLASFLVLAGGLALRIVIILAVQM